MKKIAILRFFIIAILVVSCALTACVNNDKNETTEKKPTETTENNSKETTSEILEVTSKEETTEIITENTIGTSNEKTTDKTESEYETITDGPGIEFPEVDV